MRRVIMLVVLVVLVAGCEEQKSVLKKMPTSASYDMTQIETKGNFSWVPLATEKDALQSISEILGAMAAFEEQYPDLEIVNWHIEVNGGSWPYGIWVQHRKKIIKPENESPK